ncbi:MAG: DUF3352 domain-containing protein [Bacteroidales bacterium]|nr:DUF3352 domain-containing protein [Bacteroidales bacterium]
MKKFIRWLFLLAILGGGGYLAYIFLLKPSGNYQSIYLVPKDAVFIIETTDPINAWDEIVHSDAWVHLQTNEFLAELNEDLESVDTMINSKQGLFKLLGSRSVLLSLHEYAPKKYDFLFVVDLKRASRLSSLTDYLGSLLGDGYTVTKRTYNSNEIIEILDIEYQDLYYLSIIQDQAVISFNHKLIEKSIDEYEDPVIGRDFNYLDVSKRIASKNLFRVYVNYNYLDDYVNSSLSQPDPMLDMLSKTLCFTGLSFDIEKSGIIGLQGYTNLNDTVKSYIRALHSSGQGRIEIGEILPKRIAMFADLGFESFSSFYDNFENALKSDAAAYDSYTSGIKKVEKKLKISIKENFVDWVDDEIAVVQTQPSGLGKNNEMAIILKAKDAEEAEKNLDFINEQIKKNAPIKFKEVDYKGYPIKYLSLTGFFKLILGKLFAKLEKPYYTQIDRYVIFSNHPQTIKNIIDDYLKGETLNTSIDYYRFLNNFNKNSNIFVYIQTPIVFENLKQWTGPETYNKLKANQDYINCFPQIGFQMESKDNLFETSIIARFDTGFVIPEKVIVPVEEDLILEDDTSSIDYELIEEVEIPEVSEIIVDDLSASKHKEYFEDGSLKLEVGLKNGLLHGVFREYYENGNLKIKGRFKENLKTSTWKYYNENGDQVAEKEFDEDEEISE